MSRVCSSSNRWYQAYTPQHFTHYLKVKYFSEWAHGIYESIYVRLDERVTYSRAREAIKKGKTALSIARQLRKEANHFPAQLCQLMNVLANNPSAGVSHLARNRNSEVIYL